MNSDWSESIVVIELSDEPTLSEEMHAIIDRVQRPKTKVPNVVLNFNQVTYLNSSNLAQLLRLKKLLHERDAGMRMCSVADQVWTLFLVTGLDKVFRFAPDPMTALAGLQLEDEERKKRM